MEEEPGEPTVYYQGRWWDAPMTDNAIKIEEPRDWGPCAFCSHPMTKDDDVMVMPYIKAHLECLLRSGLGDVNHLEGRCICCSNAGAAEDHWTDWRESAKATMAWLIGNNRGRFRND